ncbi:EAL domain-containing protein [Rheinheimera salexigens]|uniref:EAL domain-containing protein n=1 Tax=Rheinheimera salexigens TaxID=1628148 RepID=UPI0019118FC3|nr:EAL domain-containing protein [Rheinheimera salexigens]
MAVVLGLSSPLYFNSLSTNYNLPWLQLISWLLLIVGLIGRFNNGRAGWNKLSLVSFTVLALLMLALLLVNTGTLGSLQFANSPSVALNTAIFLLFSAIAGLTAPSRFRFNFKAYRYNLGSWLALSLTVFTILLWLNFMHQLEVGNQKIVQETVLKFKQQSEQIVDLQKGLMQRLGERIAETNTTYQPQQLSQDLNSYLRDFTYLEYIAVLDSAGNVYYSSAKTSEIKHWYDNYVETEYALLANKMQALENEKVSFYYNELVDHSLVKMRLKQPNALGVSEIIAGINFQQVMQSTIPVIVPTGYAITLAYENKLDLLLSQLNPERQYFQLGEYAFNSLSDINWQLQLYRDYALELNFVRQVSEVILFAGWLACILALLSQQYQLQMQWQQKRLIVGNRRLSSSLKIQNKLQTHHAQFMRNSADLLCIVGSEGNIIEISESSEMVLGYLAEELIGRKFMDFVHTSDQDITQIEADKIINGQDTQYFRNRYIKKDGTVVHLMWSARYVPSVKTIYAVARDVTKLVKAERYQQAQQHILELISVEKPLAEILTAICLMAEAHNPAIKACVMLKVDQHLQITSAPSLSPSYHAALANVPIAHNAGSCGTAAFEKSLVVVEDVTTDPKWLQYSDVVLSEKLTACWSMPLVFNEDNVLGTFALYCDSARGPVEEELELMASCCRFAANAIEQVQQKQLLNEGEQRFRSLYQFNPQPVYVLDKQGYFSNINNAGSQLLEWPLVELTKMHFSRVILNEQLAEVTEYFSSAISGSPESFETSILSRTGNQHELQITLIPTWIDGEIVGVIGMAKDVTQHLQTEKQLRLFKRAVDASYNGVVISDITQPDMPITYVNSAFEKFTGYSKKESIGRNCRFLQGTERDELAIEPIRLAIESKQEVSVILKNYRKDGTLFWNNLYLSPVPDEAGAITHYIGIQTDITEQKKYEKELAFNASHDLLTGLPNRSLLRDRLVQNVKASARHKEKVAVLFIDLDGFKLINDSLGHLFGDEVIRQVSARINKQIRPGDTLARMGGDEFVLMLPDIKDINQLNDHAERVLIAISTPFKVSGRELQITASIGISVSNNDITEPMELVKQADLAMYQAKRLGRNNVQWYQAEMEILQNKRLNLRAMLKQAIENQEFELYYQPQVEAGSGRLVGLEALLRWQHPVQGFIGPDEFIPIAEETGLIIEIGQWVIEQAATYNRSLQQRGLAELVMAVNISSLQFQREGFVEQLEQTLNKVQLAPKWFELELTESLLLENIEQVIHKLQHLKQLGISIAIDDFGTGFSSLNYLKRLPLDKLKIDKSFINDLVTDKKDAAITRAIIAMAHQLELKVIAEGVETLAQSTLLQKNVCDELQGYFFSRPLPADKLEVFLKNYLPS